MADENAERPNPTDLTAAAQTALTASYPGQELAAPVAPTTTGQPAWARIPVPLRWLMGFWLIFMCGWGLFAIEYFITKAFGGVSPAGAYVFTALLSLAIFYLLEQNFWLTRFLGAPVYPTSSPLKSALALWLFGVLWLFLRGIGNVPEQRTPAESKASRPAVAHRPDPLHESLETIVFVVFLVVLLKAFVAEAFVIPTGSMATTLLGYNRTAVCDKCRWSFTVNAADETEMGHGAPGPITHAVCPHCGHVLELNQNGGPTGGDKVLVFKPAYDVAAPERFNVIVFKYPRSPQEQFVAKNYIKRLWGLPGDKLAILYGDVFLRGMVDGKETLDMLRKPPAQQLEMRRIVYHNDFPRQDLIGVVPPRWADEAKAPTWKPSDDGKTFQISPAQWDAWLRYRHLMPLKLHELEARLVRMQANSGFAADREDSIEQLRKKIADAAKEPVDPSLITDTVGYNTFRTDTGGSGWRDYSWNWVPDLMLECEVVVEQATGELTLQLIAGTDKHDAVFDLATGQCTLRVSRKDQVIAQKEASTAMKRAGKYHLRFSNFDARLTLWVDGKLVFGDGLEFAPPKDEERGPRVADVKPAAIGARHASLKVQHLQLWRDIYYTRTAGNASSELNESMDANRISLDANDLAHFNSPYEKVSKWAPYLGHHPQYYEVRPGEYFALGDNSTFSSDSRDWGGVPERLLLGRAVFVYWPITRFGPIW